MKSALKKLKALQIAVDAILIVSAFVLAYLVRFEFIFYSTFPFSNYMIIALITTPITIWLMFFARTYKLTQQILSWRHAQRIGFVAVENVAIFMVLYYFTYRVFFSRMILVYLFLFTFIFVYGWHLVFRWILKKHFEQEIGVYRTLVIGANRPAEQIVGMLIREKSHIKPVAIINAHGGGQTQLHGVPIVGKMNQFEKIIDEYNVDVILQMDHLEQSLNIINHALAKDIKYIMPPELLGIFQGHQVIEEVEGVPFLLVNKKRHWWHSIW